MNRIRTIAPTIVFLCIGAFFAATRALALFQPYHQDEYKWVTDAAKGLSAWTTIPHPPLAFWIYAIAGKLIGYADLRLVPIILSAALIAGGAWYLRREFGVIAAGFFAFFYATVFYALLASVQIDIDGAFLPLAALLAYLPYRKALAAQTSRIRFRYAILTAAAIIIGLFVKLSFILVPAALAVDLVIRFPQLLGWVRRPKIIAGLVSGIALVALALAFAWNRVVFLENVGNYLAFSGRAYGEMLFETAKAALYLSPVLFAGVVYGWRYRKELSFWFIFLALNALFYFVVFDFTHRTFDRYLMFFILPAAVIASVAFTRRFTELGTDTRNWWGSIAAWTLGGGVVVFILARLPHEALPLIPKSGFVDAVIHGKFSILIPFTGGSGPLGFYAPLDALLAVWIAVFVAFLISWRRKYAVYALAAVIGISLTGNVLLTEEYLFGGLYGSAPEVTRALDRAIASSTVPVVITYNDTGAYELLQAGKYAGRFYPHPEFVADNIQKFSAGPGYYLVVNMPLLNPAISYGRYFASCKTLATSRSGGITGAVYDCRGISPQKIATY